MTSAQNNLLDRAVSIYPKGVRHAFSEDQVSACRTLVDRMIAESQKAVPEANWCPISIFLKPGSPRLTDELLGLFLRSQAFAVVRTMLGDRVVVLLQHTIVRRRQAALAADRSPWHLDVDFMGGDGEMLNMWIPLVDVGTGHPGLTFIVDKAASTRIWEYWLAWAAENWSPGTRRTDKSLFGDDENVARLAGTELSQIAKTPILRAGDAILFNQAILHRTQDATSAPGPRHSVEFRLARPSDLPETYKATAMPVAVIEVGEGKASISYQPSDHLLA